MPTGLTTSTRVAGYVPFGGHSKVGHDGTHRIAVKTFVMSSWRGGTVKGTPSIAPSPVAGAIKISPPRISFLALIQLIQMLRQW